MSDSTVRKSWALWAYAGLFDFLTPLWAWLLHRRLKRGKETPLSLDDRWVRSPPARPTGTLVWGHAVGVGEALALAGLMRRLQEQRADLSFLLTTTARTSGQALQQQNLGPRFIHCFAPIDTSASVQKFLHHWHPDLAIWCEMDLWPNLIHATACRQIPHYLVNARIHPKSALKSMAGGIIYKPLLTSFDAIWAQNKETADFLLTQGVAPAKLKLTGTLKSITPPLNVDRAEWLAWEQALNGRQVWAVASSHPGEEQLALDAHALIRQAWPDALLILVPRMPLRGPAVAALCGPHTPMRSTGQALPSAHACYVADTMGELGLWYRLCPVVMVGGSWAPVGGHNPYEAVHLGKRVIHGPMVSHFQESYSDLDACGQTRLAHSAPEIAKIVLQAWQEWPENQTQQPANFNAALLSNIEALIGRLPPEVQCADS